VAEEGQAVEIVVSMSEAGRQLGVDQRVVSHMLSALGLEARPHPSNARAKGVTIAQVATLREAIEAGRRVVAQSA
jgi:hypothetical protein